MNGRPLSPDEQLYKLLNGMIAFVRTKNWVENVDALVAQGANVNGAKGQGELLQMAVNNGNAAAVRELLDRGADPHVEVHDDGKLTTLLHIAANKGNYCSTRIILILVAAGLDPYEKKDSSGMTAQWIAQKHEGVAPIFSYPLHYSVRNSDMDLCANFLDRGYNPEDGDYMGNTPIALAQKKGLKGICALFDANKAMRAIEQVLKNNSNHKTRISP